MDQDYEALVLAGGQGTRLREVVSDRPKVIAEVNGRPFLTFLLDQLLTAGISRVTLCVGYKSDQVKDTIGYRYHGLEVRFSDETTPLGTGGALRLAVENFASTWMLVLNGDSLIECDLSNYVSWHFNQRHENSLVVAKVSDVDRYGSVELDGNQRVISFKEKSLGLIGAGQINAGVYFMPRAAILQMPLGATCSLEKTLIPRLVPSGLHGYVCEGRFIDIGTAESYRQADSFFQATEV